jgi:outer membrane protein OmpA-like peptidoglycan-associated protein
MNRFTGIAALLAIAISAGAAYIAPSQADDQQADGPTHVSVYFRPGATVLTTEAGAMLDHMASVIKDKHAGRLIITGYASDGATAPDEQTIAAARANAVETRLIANGVDAARIQIGVGQSSALGHTAEAPAFIDGRRTDITVVPASADRFQF